MSLLSTIKQEISINKAVLASLDKQIAKANEMIDRCNAAIERSNKVLQR